MKPHVLVTEPVLLEKVWGGDRLGARVGEAWLCADLDEGQSLADGERLSHWVKLWGNALTGDDVERFPLLIKLIDAAQDLSVQVHPSREAAKDDPDAHPKDECWLILDKKKDAGIYHGFVPGTSRQDFERALDEGHPERCLRWFSLEPGEAIRVEPGTVHAIGAGVFLLECQEPSDTTYRVWDWGRMGLDGKPRALHKDRALAVSAFDTVADGPIKGPIRAPSYALEQLSVDGEHTLVAHPRGPTVLVNLRGELSVDGRALPELSAAIVPASLASVNLEGRAQLALCTR